MKNARTVVFRSVALVSVSALAAACGSYTALPAGSNGGATSSDSGGATSSSNGGATSSDSGGSPGSNGGSATGGASSSIGGSATGGAPSSNGGSATGGAIAKGGSDSGGSATGGAVATGGSVANGGTNAGGAATGGNKATGGAATGGAPATGGAVGTGGAPAIALPCDVLKAGGQTCVSAHSTVRVIVGGYTGPLYQLCKGSAVAGPSSCKGTMQDVGSTAGYANVSAHTTFCPTGTTCTITKIYDQSGQGNHLEPAPRGGAKGTPDNPAVANDLPVTVGGHAAYGILIKAGIGYRTGCSACTIKQGNGMAKGDEPTTQFWITSQKDLIDGCCFDYGNAETTSNDDGNGTMETLYFGGGVVWGTGYGGKPGPWLMADLENGLFAGWENGQDKNISTNKALKFDYVTGVLLGDTREKNNNKGRFALYGGDATAGILQTMYDGIRPAKAGYVPMTKQGSLVLGIGGDNSNSAGGRFYEGAVAGGPCSSKATVDALQAAIVAAKYGQ